MVYILLAFNHPLTFMYCLKSVVGKISFPLQLDQYFEIESLVDIFCSNVSCYIQHVSRLPVYHKMVGLTLMPVIWNNFLTVQKTKSKIYIFYTNKRAIY